MSRSLNKVMLIGNVGNDPEIRATGSGARVAKVSLATNRSWSDRSGQQQEKTEWHRLTFFGRLVDIVEQWVKKGDRLYVTTASPGHLHIFDIGKDPKAPRLLKSLPAAQGAHHVAFTKDWKHAFVQNALLSLPGMSDGSITVVDLQKEEVIASVDTLKKTGFNPNSIVLLPRWNHPAGH